MHVELTKVRASPQAQVEPGNWDTYTCGSLNNTTSLPVDYVLTGFLPQPVELGKPVRILRITRNGVSALGIFQSTAVVLMTDDGFTTRNSVYRLRIIETSAISAGTAPKRDFTESVLAWLNQPNPAFEGKTTAQLLKLGNTQPVIRMLYELESGEPT